MHQNPGPTHCVYGVQAAGITSMIDAASQGTSSKGLPADSPALDDLLLQSNKDISAGRNGFSLDANVENLLRGANGGIMPLTSQLSALGLDAGMRNGHVGSKTISRGSAALLHEGDFGLRQTTMLHPK